MSFRKLDNRVLSYCVPVPPESSTVCPAKIFKAEDLRNPEILVEIFNDIIHNKAIESNTFEALLAAQRRWKMKPTPPEKEEELNHPDRLYYPDF